MTTITVALPDRLRDWAELQAKAAHHENVADYVRALIKDDLARADTIAEVQMLLDEGFASGISDRSMSEVLEDARSQARDTPIA